jgi:hypothetical protein
VLVGRAEWGQPAPRLVVGLLARGGHEAFQSCKPWAHNVLPAQLVTSQLEQQRRFVMLSGALAYPRLQGIAIQGRGEAEVQVRPHVLEVGGPCGPACARGSEGLGRHTQLLCHVLDRQCWRRRQIIGRKPCVP